MPREDRAKPLSDRIRILHMLDAARQAKDFIAGRERADLDSDAMLRRAVKDCIQEIGEAATKVSQAIRSQIPELPWNQMVGMRHRIVHVYYDIDTNALWEVATRDLPVLIAAMERALSAWPDDPQKTI
jgi:uncharacterized protein with HEPN domain